MVTWVAPADNGLPITGYDVEYCTGTCAATSTDWTDGGDPGTDTRQRITGLNNDTAYKVRVRAINSLGGAGQGLGPWSASRTGTPKALPDAPGEPTLTAGERQITVSWSAPGQTNGTTINGYHVQYRACTATPRDCSSNPRWGRMVDTNPHRSQQP